MLLLDISQSSKRGCTETMVSGAFITRTFVLHFLRLTSTAASTTKASTTWQTNAHALK